MDLVGFALGEFFFGAQLKASARVESQNQEDHDVGGKLCREVPGMSTMYFPVIETQ
ncbi:Putative hypothetical protein [Helicobacter mustelae 12198]|uniref:Uncharacterized protein n=1 Tax=Helicobacter mustelae (strain ATCC 43772 / CCUG 25715 / CIP 103759 / LMG 18044 / NCTC 12198 / R85-136P) TaxID=679897 RepID=D3UI66_HELM1|nr:Putative hypothetical protein [Helicobacter mustelae 12198]